MVNCHKPQPSEGDEMQERDDSKVEAFLQKIHLAERQARHEIALLVVKIRVGEEKKRPASEEVGKRGLT